MKHTRISAVWLIILLMLSAFIGCRAPVSTPTDTTDTLADTEATMTAEPSTETDTQAPCEPETDEPPSAADRLTETLANKVKLRFDENGEFKIMMLSDLHLYGNGLSAVTQENIRLLVKHERPNLIILNGDNVADPTVQSEGDLRRLLKELTDYLESEGIYWIHVYGNHDGETKLPLVQQQRVYESYGHCLSKRGDVGRLGVGNYVLPLYGAEDDEIKFVIWALNSGDYLSFEDREALFPAGKTSFPGNGAPKYDYIHSEQIAWYEEIADLLKESNGGKPVPGLMAFHIPLQESYTAWINRDGLEWTGQKGGDVGSSAYNTGFFEVLRRRGDVKAVVNGHDHANDFMVSYGGIKLCYCSTVSNNAHHDPNILGTRLFIIRESDPADVETYMTYVKNLR